ncbi:hypothetical protein [Pseudomonas sp. PD9R]|uniref:hypothetical protein n=1 Tax=Pseudomonas sp. PD9R TaxID=2853534 RepID=UPI001C456762|nr:hypothetical protein [Pseudomonas sp. PD9R]MBV6822871.1 hypothetical protein [Pseudomonas sp. PD9R]
MLIRSLTVALSLISALPVYAAGYGDIQFRNMTKSTVITAEIYGKDKRILSPGEMFLVAPYPVAGGFLTTTADAPAVTSITVSESTNCTTTYTALCIQLFSKD